MFGIKLLAFTLALLICGQVWAAAPVVNQITDKAGFAGSSGTEIFSFNATPAANSNIYVACFGWVGGGSYSISSVTDNQSGSYAVTNTSSPVAQGGASVARAHNVSPSGTHTITVTQSSGAYGACIAVAVTGLDLTSSLDQSAQATDAGPQAADANVSTAGFTTVSDEFVLAVASITDAADGNMNIQTPSGFTSLVKEQDFSFCCAGSIDYKIINTTGTQSVAWSHDDIVLSDPQFDGWNALIQTFKAAAGGVVARRKTSPMNMSD
jgi:hypothetical protein